MRWIRDSAEFEQVALEAMTCVFIDSNREATHLVRRNFQDIDTFSREFALLIEQLLVLSGDSAANYIVLRPDPKWFFERILGRFPAFQIELRDTPEDYIAALNHSLSENPGDSLDTISDEWAVFPSSLKWFAHVHRSSENDSGHLWAPRAWLSEAIETFPFLCEPT